MIQIRKAVGDEAETILELRKAAILDQCQGHYPAETLATWAECELTSDFIQSVGSHWYVATIDDVIVGTGAIDCQTGQLDGLMVHPNRMRQGIGKQIMTFLENVGRSSGLTRISLDSTLNAAEFYRSCGFVGDEIGAYQSPRGITLECIPMTKVLLP